MSSWTKPLLLLPMLFAGCLSAEPLQKVFFDWQLTCNNADFCLARSLSGEQGLVMTLSRHAGAHDRPLLRIDYGSAWSGELAGAALRDNLLLDRRRLLPDFKRWTVAAHHLTTDNTIAIEELLAQLLESENIQITWRPQAQISLHGLKAALSLMDNVQGRTNGLSAWSRRGSRAAVDTPLPPALPLLPAAAPLPAALTRSETSGLLDYGSWRINGDACSLDPGQREVNVAPLTDRKALLMVSCERGAYNMINLAFAVTRAPPYVAQAIRLTLPFTPPRGERQLELINAEYDASRGELYTFSKGRGLGDCGTATRWRFNGSSFTLAEYAEESVCDVWHSSDDWPTLWVSSSP